MKEMKRTVSADQEEWERLRACMKDDDDFDFYDGYYGYRGEPHYVETEDEFIGQASNGHIQVFDKKTGRMTMHITCTKMLSDDEMVETVQRLIKFAEEAMLRREENENL